MPWTTRSIRLSTLFSQPVGLPAGAAVRPGWLAALAWTRPVRPACTGRGENVSEEIGLSVFNRLRRYRSGQFGMIRAGSARKRATIWATNSCNRQPARSPRRTWHSLSKNPWYNGVAGALSAASAFGLRVSDDAIFFDRLVVRFDDGTSQELIVSERISPGTRNYVIDLQGEGSLESVEFWYYKEPWGHNPRVSLYGARSPEGDGQNIAQGH
jgi:hypothetical protein